MADCVVFASGRGSNFQAIHRHLQGTRHRIAALVCNRLDSPSLDYADLHQIPTILAEYRKDKSKEETERQILSGFSPYPDIKLVVLAGYMRILSPHFLRAFPGPVINIHPSLLPRHPGQHGLIESIRSTDQELGVSIHYVDEGVDSGPIIVQESFLRKTGQSEAELERIIHAIEHRLYPRAVEALLDEADSPL